MTEPEYVTPQAMSTWRPHMNAGDLIQIGTKMANAGMSTLAAQGLTDKLQRRAMATAMDTTNEVLDEVRKVMEAELHALADAIRRLLTYQPTAVASFINGGNRNQTALVQRDEVLALVAQVASRVVRP